MDEQIKENQEKEVVAIHPLKKGRRILLFLADFFMHFMLTFLLFNIAVAPIGKAITNFKDKNQQHIDMTAEMYQHYYKSGVLLKDSSFEYYDATAGVEYTYRCFLSYYVLDTEESTDPNYPQYGHKIENDTIHHFYYDIRNNPDGYIDGFKHYNEKSNYFLYDEVTNSFSLKIEVKNELYAYYDVKDEMGDEGKKYFDAISKEVFNPLMAEVMTDIEKNDLHYDGEKCSFVECKRIIKEVEDYHAVLMTVCAYISHFISWLGLFLILPLINKNRKTLAMVFMKIERVDFYTLNHVKRPIYLINATHYLFATLLGVLFIPSLLVPFNTLFTLNFLIYGTAFSGLLLIADLIFLLVNQYNRSLVDYLSNNLFLTEAEMDELYRARGYTI